MEVCCVNNLKGGPSSSTNMSEQGCDTKKNNPLEAKFDKSALK